VLSDLSSFLQQRGRGIQVADPEQLHRGIKCRALDSLLGLQDLGSVKPTRARERLYYIEYDVPSLGKESTLEGKSRDGSIKKVREKFALLPWGSLSSEGCGASRARACQSLQ